MRPCDSVAGTRCTRCTPPSYLRCAQTPCGGVGRVALDRELHVLDAAEVARGLLDDLGLPLLRLGVVQVHAQQVAGEERGLCAALPHLDLHDDVTGIVGVARDQQAAKLSPARRPALRSSPGSSAANDSSSAANSVRGRDVIGQLSPLVVGGDDAREFRVPAVDLLRPWPDPSGVRGRRAGSAAPRARPAASATDSNTTSPLCASSCSVRAATSGSA